MKKLLLIPFVLLMSCGGKSKLDKTKEYRTEIQTRYDKLKDSVNNNLTGQLQALANGDMDLQQSLESNYKKDSARWEQTLKSYKSEIDSLDKVVLNLSKN